MSVTEIIPGLWLGDEKSFNDKKFIERAGIRFIINCSKDLAENGFGIDNIRISVDDRPSISHMADNDIMSGALDSTVEYIHKSLMMGKSVLVHCKAGRQRSACIVAAYLMKYGEVDIDKAVYYVRTKRPIAFDPNVNFLPALKKYWQLVSSTLS